MRKEDLYGLPLDEFTPARDALARELRQAGKKEAAETVKALRKPSLHIWAVNQAVRRRPEVARDLVDAGAELRKAQRQAVSRSDPDVLRVATRAHREVADALTEVARETLAERGDVSQGVLTKVAQTLRAASVDKEAAKSLPAGTLADEVEQAGFGPLLSAVPSRPRKARAAPKPKPEPPPKPRPDPNARKRKQLQAQLERARARVGELEARLRELGD